MDNQEIIKKLDKNQDTTLQDKNLSAPGLLKDFEDKLDKIKLLYPKAKSAIMPALYLAQEYFGYINNEAINWISEKLDIAPAHVMEVASFYTMFYKNKVGKYHIQLCRTLSCHITGAKILKEYIQNRLKIESGSTSQDGLWSFEEVECLGSCGTAPMCQINDRFFENLSKEKLEEIIDTIIKDKPSLRLSSVDDKLCDRLKQYSKSSVYKSNEG